MAELLTAEEEARIEALIGELEQSTAGELVVVVARRCDDYAAWRVPWVGGLTVVIALSVYLWVPLVPPEAIFVGQLVLGAALWRLSGIKPCVRCLVPRQEFSDRLSAMAQQLFVARGVTETRDRSGVLLLISELEHGVQILADRGIHMRVGADAWKKQTDAIIAAIRAGRPADGICAALREIGAHLAEAFPPRSDDINELADAIQRLD